MTPVTDEAMVSLRVQVEHVAFDLQGGSSGGWIKPVGDNLDTGGDLNSFTAEFVYSHRVFLLASIRILPLTARATTEFYFGQVAPI